MLNNKIMLDTIAKQHAENLILRFKPLDVGMRHAKDCAKLLVHNKQKEDKIYKKYWLLVRKYINRF